MIMYGYIQIKNIITVFLAMAVFSCNNSLKEVQDLNAGSYGPMSIAENINTKYTDSGRLTSILVSPKMYNFTNDKFPYYEFPNGINFRKI